MKKTTLLRILVPAVIVLAVAGIWFLKNGAGAGAGKPGQAVASDNPDFALNITGTVDLEKMKSYGLPILIEFGADDCPPCKEMAPIIEALNSELQGRAIVRFADVWKDPSLAQDFPLTVIPTQMFIDSTGRPFMPSDPDAIGIDLNIYEDTTTDEHAFTTHEGIVSKNTLLAVLEEMGMK